MIAVGECESSKGQQVSQFGVSRLQLVHRNGTQRTAQRDIAQGVRNALGVLSLCALLLGNGTFVLCHFRSLNGLVLCHQCVLPLLFCLTLLLLGILPFLLCQLGLLDSCLALLVTDAALLIGNLLHLGIHTLHDGRLFLLFAQNG